MYGVATKLDLSSAGNGLDADGTKLYCTTMAKNVADRAVQVTCRSALCVFVVKDWLDVLYQVGTLLPRYIDGSSTSSLLMKRGIRS